MSSVVYISSTENDVDCWGNNIVCEQGRNPGVPQKILGGVSIPLKMSNYFTQNRCCITLQVPHHQGRKTCVKMERETIFFRGAYTCWLSGTGIVKYLEIIDVGCDLKEFDGLT